MGEKGAAPTFVPSHASASGAVSGQVLLDLVKAFERIPHWFLVQQAIKQRVISDGTDEFKNDHSGRVMHDLD